MAGGRLVVVVYVVQSCIWLSPMQQYWEDRSPSDELVAAIEAMPTCVSSNFCDPRDEQLKLEMLEKEKSNASYRRMLVS